MSQQLNLLPPPSSRYSPAVVALMILGFVAVVLFAAWGVKRATLAGVRAEEVASAAQLKEVSTQFEKRFRARAEQINAEIEALKPRAAEAQQVMALATGLGKPEGYSPYFASLAAVREDGLWLNGVTVGQAGKLLQLDGRSLDKSTVLRYTQRLNAALADSGVTLAALKLDVESLGGKAAGAATGGAGGGGKNASLTVLKFSLR